MAITELHVRRTRLLWVVVLAVSLVLAWVRWTPLHTVRIASASMTPGLHVGDRALVLGSWKGSDRGDVVVFRDPGGWSAAAEHAGERPSGDLFVKRVIGVGGDTVVCCDVDGRLQVNGTALTESHLGGFRELLAFSVTVPAGHLWVMGDNRDRSFDSRYAGSTPGAGFVPEGAVTGTVVWSW